MCSAVKVIANGKHDYEKPNKDGKIICNRVIYDISLDQIF